MLKLARTVQAVKKFLERAAHKLRLDRWAGKLHGQKGMWMRLCCLFFLFCVAACEKDVPYSERSLYTIYTDGMKKMDEGTYESASEEFDQVGQQYPYSEWAPNAQVMSGYALYLARKYNRAIGVFENFAYLHPYHPDAAYAYYMIGLCYFRQIIKVDRDVQNTENAYSALQMVINRFPDSRYAQDAQKKAAEAYNKLAAYHMLAGHFYQSKKLYLAALDSFRRVQSNFPVSVYGPEALYRMIECSAVLSMSKEAHEAQRLLAQRYPQSEWRRDGEVFLKKAQL